MGRGSCLCPMDVLIVWLCYSICKLEAGCAGISWDSVCKTNLRFLFDPSICMALQRSLFQRETLICVVSPLLNWLVLYLAGSELVLLFPKTPERTKPKESLLAGETRFQQLVKTMENPPCHAELKTRLKN